MTSEVGKDRVHRFPYSGYGFSWTKVMVGKIGSNNVSLEATRVAREKRWRFPYLGYGRAWTEEMTGKCGDRLTAMLAVTDIGRSSEYGFPYKGFGFGWAKNGKLTLSLKE
jgi:hypothetical protein